MDEYIGIDFGTSNSRVAVMEGSKAKVIDTTPSFVGFHTNGEPFMGTQAKHQVITDLRDTLFGTKRLLGRRYEEIQIRKEITRLPFNIVKLESFNGEAGVEANGYQFSIGQIVAFHFTKMKLTAEAYIGKKIKRAAVTIPGNFIKPQRTAMINAAFDAGIHKLEFITDPTCIALTYAVNHHKSEGLIAILDLGGGSFDVSVVNIQIDALGYQEFEIKSLNGDMGLGGVDSDEAIVDFLVKDFKRKEGIYLSNDVVSLQRPREAAEHAKIELSLKEETEIYVPFITRDNFGVKHMNVTLSRSTFENEVKHLTDQIRMMCTKCITDAGISTEELDEVLLVGGMSKVPIVKQAVTEVFGKTPFEGLNPDEAVATIAALFAGSLSRVGRKPKVVDNSSPVSRWGQTSTLSFLDPELELL